MIPTMSNTPALSGLQCFDPKQDHTIAWKRLPHWAQAGTVCFITWRTADSLPKEVIGRLNQRRQEILREQLGSTGISVAGATELRRRVAPAARIPTAELADTDWKQALAKLPPALRGKLHWLLFTVWGEQLDAAAGACVLRKPELSEIVMKSLLHFDNDRYVLTDAVVMPNHVHLLVAFREEDMLLTQCTSWKHYTAVQINRWLKANLSRGTTELRSPVVPRPGTPPTDGEFWQVEQFDHLVRSPEDFDKYRHYIADNPRQAGLPEGSFRYFTNSVTR